MDRVQITGSLIPTADTVGVAPVETVDAERITLTGQQDILAVLRRYSTSFAGSGNAGQTENNGGFGEANVALRNLSTLILLDGRRLASSAFSNGAAVDVNTLPLAMIDRIEILKDGSSTIYGSDAVGGVVNIITKKNWNGFEVGTRYGFATGNGYFNETQAHAVYGYAKDGVRLTTGINYYQSDPLYTKNRKSASLGRQELIDRGVNPPTYVSPSYSGRVSLCRRSSRVSSRLGGTTPVDWWALSDSCGLQRGRRRPVGLRPLPESQHGAGGQWVGRSQLPAAQHLPAQYHIDPRAGPSQCVRQLREGLRRRECDLLHAVPVHADREHRPIGSSSADWHRAIRPLYSSRECR
jgi:outer membrane receptor protein involved in Fe transport